MNAVEVKNGTAALVLDAATAADLMVPSPVSIEADATVGEAVGLLVGKGYSAAPVIDEAGRAVGVLSCSDLLIHGCECRGGAVPDYYTRTELAEGEAETAHRPDSDAVRVRDLMTPVVFTVAPDAPASRVVSDLLSLKVHRLFVSDRAGVLVGVISALDVLQHLRPLSLYRPGRWVTGVRRHG